jgi:hypothetical protein
LEASGTTVSARRPPEFHRPEEHFMSISSLTDPPPGSGATPGSGSDAPPEVERLKAGSVGLSGVMFMAIVMEDAQERSEDVEEPSVA